jgi:hypothetical protein
MAKNQPFFLLYRAFQDLQLYFQSDQKLLVMFAIHISLLHQELSALLRDATAAHRSEDGTLPASAPSLRCMMANQPGPKLMTEGE